MTELADVIDKAAGLIEPEGRWTQWEFARDAEGYAVSVLDPGAKCFCALGALSRVAPGVPPADAGEAIRRALSLDSLVTFNDDPDRTQAEVVAAMRKAAADLRAGVLS